MPAAVTIWKQSPLLPCLLALIAGITIYAFFPIPLVIAAILAVAAFTGLCSTLRRRREMSFRMIGTRSLFIYLLWISTGILLSYFRDARHAAGWYGHYSQNINQIVVKITEPPAEKAKTYQVVASMVYIFSKAVLRPVSGRVILYFEKDSTSRSLRYGDELIIDNVLQDIRNSGNPGAFNYRQYCVRQNIFQQAFLHQEEWKKIRSLPKPDLRYYLFLARAYCISILQKYIPRAGSPGLAAALLIGYRDNVNPEILQAYTDTGVVHVIAISGMHLGLIYMMLLFLLRPLKDNRSITRYIKGSILLVILWAFSLLTGAPGSVLRSAVMFSVIAAGRFFFNRESTTFNTLAVAAFLLLCYDPNLLFDVGFQLSYLAVGSIVIFQQPVYTLFSFRYLLPDKLWEMISISLAAQVLTTPVCLYYFHQFPLVFLASNIIAVPLSSIILIVLIVLMAIAGWAWAATWIGKLAGSLIALMNACMLWLDHFRWARISGIVISGPDMLLGYMIIGMLMVWLFRKKPRGLVWASVLILLLTLSISFRMYRHQRQRKIIVYNTPPGRAVECVDGGKIYFTGDAAVMDCTALFRRQVLPAHWQLHAAIVKQDDHCFFDSSSGVLQFYDKKLLIIDTPFTPVSSPPFVRVDYVILSHAPPVSISWLCNWCRFDTIIFDASNPLWKIRQWKNECEELNLPRFSVPDQGAFISNIY